MRPRKRKPKGRKKPKKSNKNLMNIFGQFSSSAKKAILLWLFLSLIFVGVPPFVAEAATVDELKQSLQEEIEALGKKIGEHQKLIDQYRRNSVSLQRDISIFNQKISQLELEIKQIQLTIQKIQIEISRKTGEISKAEVVLSEKREVLGGYLKQIYEDDQKTLLEMLLKNRRLSELFDDLNSLDVMQSNVYQIISDIQKAKEELMDEKYNLGERKNEVLSLKAMIDVQKRSLEKERQNKNEILKETKSKETTYKTLLESDKRKLEQLRQQLSYLEKAGISTADAVNYARLAAARTGVRPAFLLAIMEIESEMGMNVGRGNWRDDMYQCYINYGKKTVAEQLKDAFFAITKKLGLNPDSTPVSRRIPSVSACGGALGIAQFMPTTWLAYEARIAKATGHNPPSPWNFEDAFMATALFLADRGAGAGTRDAEDRAARAYVGGKPTCSSNYCNIYARKAVNLTASIEAQL